jgi:hypothetical protein
MGLKPTDFDELVFADLNTSRLFFSQTETDNYKVQLGEIRTFMWAYDFSPALSATTIPTAILEVLGVAEAAAEPQDADEVAYDDTDTSLGASNVQEAIEALKAEIDAISVSGAAVDITYDNTDSELDAENVQDAIDEIVEDINALPPVITTAAGITYDNTDSELEAENVQDAIDELKELIDDFEFSGTAEQVSYDPSTSGLSALNVQDAIDQIAVQFTDYPMVKNSLGDGETLTVPAGKQLIVWQSFTNEGVLTLLGELVILPEG